MQQPGALKKRHRRNLSKVNGLSNIQYNKEEDTFDEKFVLFPSKPLATLQVGGVASCSATKLRISSLFQESHRQNNKSRVTRNPNFHNEFENEEYKLGDEEYHHVPLKVTHAETEGVTDRPYFLHKSTITRLRQILLLGIFSGTFPWKWNAKKYRIDKWSPFWEKAWKLQWGIITLQTSLISIFQLYVCWQAITVTQIFSYRKLFISCIYLLWYLFAGFFNINMYFYKDQIRSYINTLFQFNFEFMKKFVVEMDGYADGGRIVMKLSIPFTMWQVVVSPLAFFGSSFQPWYLMSYIYPKPWYWLVPGAIQDFLVVGQVVTNYILYQWIVVAHANTMEFWLKESQNNDSGHTIDELRQPKTVVETYRTLQIVCTCFNESMAPMAFPLMKLHIVLAMIPCGFIFIRSLNHVFIEDFPGSLTYPIAILDCAATGFCTLSLAATVYDLACGFVNSWGETRHKSFRRILMSCPALKVKMARFYFVTVSTTVTFFQAVIGYIIDCIITFQ